MNRGYRFSILGLVVAGAGAAVIIYYATTTRTTGGLLRGSPEDAVSIRLAWEDDSGEPRSVSGGRAIAAEICKVVSAGTPVESDKYYQVGGVLWIRYADGSHDVISFTTEPPTVLLGESTVNVNREALDKLLSRIGSSGVHWMSRKDVVRPPGPDVW